jgi:hypothetical protein
MAHPSINPVPLKVMSDSTLLSLLHTCGFKIDPSCNVPVSWIGDPRWSTEQLLDEARRRGFTVERLISRKQ